MCRVSTSLNSRTFSHEVGDLLPIEAVLEEPKEFPGWLLPRKNEEGEVLLGLRTFYLLCFLLPDWVWKPGLCLCWGKRNLVAGKEILEGDLDSMQCGGFGAKWKLFF